jgi:AraC-like DNA-binding protein
MNASQISDIEFAGAGLFKTDRDWVHPERTERTYEIIYVTKGEVYLEEGGVPLCVREGQLVILEAGVCHKGTKVTRDVSFYWVHFDVKHGTLPFQKRFFERFENRSLFKELLHWNNLPVVPDYMVNAVLAHILCEFRYLADEENAPRDERAERIREWIRINASATLKVSHVAEHFEYSADHVTRLCKENFGIGAKKLINRMLMSKARELLCNTGKYVKEIAAELEFSNDKEFIAYFKYHEGCFPGEYRKRFPMIHMNRR